jgi:hypothetical protein
MYVVSLLGIIYCSLSSNMSVQLENAFQNVSSFWAQYVVFIGVIRRNRCQSFIYCLLLIKFITFHLYTMSLQKILQEKLELEI